jgi:hypothetical protein
MDLGSLPERLGCLSEEEADPPLGDVPGAELPAHLADRVLGEEGPDVAGLDGCPG